MHESGGREGGHKTPSLVAKNERGTATCMSQHCFDADDIFNVIAKMERLDGRVRKLEANQQSYESSLTFLHDEMDEVKRQIASLLPVKDTVTALSEQRREITSSIDKIKQEARGKELLIVGIPQKPKEQLADVALSIATRLDIDLAKHDIEKIYRTQSKAMSVTFRSSEIRDSFYMARAKLRRDTVTSKTLGYTEDNIIYLNEKLTPDEHQLYYLAREKKRSLKYAYCWTYHSKIYLRKTKGNEAILISAKEDLDNVSA